MVWVLMYDVFCFVSIFFFFFFQAEDGIRDLYVTGVQTCALPIYDTIGFIFQSYNLIPFLSAVENVELPLMFEPYDRAALRRRAIELLELVGLGHRIDHQPTKMSGGEQQRTAIARSLISNPTLVLADEPTANLDHRTGETVVRMLRDLCSTMGVTVVASTHDPTVADEASRVVRMKDGQITN